MLKDCSIKFCKTAEIIQKLFLISNDMSLE